LADISSEQHHWWCYSERWSDTLLLLDNNYYKLRFWFRLH
jgi:hypothetical protein